MNRDQLNQVLISLLHTRDSIADAAAALKLPLSEFIAIATSPQAQHILAQVEALEKRRAEVLQAAAHAAALQTLHTLTDFDSLGDDDTRNIQRKSATAILTHTRATARLALDTKRAESLALHRAEQRERETARSKRAWTRRACQVPDVPSNVAPRAHFERRAGRHGNRTARRKLAAANRSHRQPQPPVNPACVAARVSCIASKVRSTARRALARSPPAAL